MIKNILFAAFILYAVGAFAQKTDENYFPAQYKHSKCTSSFTKVKLDGENNALTVEKYLKKSILNLRDKRVSLKLNYVNESPGGFHYSFTQLFNGIEVYQSEMKVNLDKFNVVHSFFDNSENTADWILNTADAGENSVIAIHPETHVPVVAERKIESNFSEVLTANGEIIFERDLRVYFSAPDSLVSGKIFNPDPLTTAQHDTTGGYVDNNDANAPWFNPQYQNVTFRTNFAAAVFTLESPYVRVSDFDFPYIAPVTSATPAFNFDRSQSGFEDVNAFYHLTTMRNYINSLGFGCADSLIEIDPHALNGADQSYFVHTVKPHRIFYGTGGVDDAEDADVCIHEYAHSVSETAASGTNFGQERESLDEGFGDYLAGSYSKSLNAFNDYWTFNWDGHNEFWKGRILNTTKIYPADISTSIYRNGEMWAAALYDIHNEIGRETTDSLILQTHYSYSSSISMRDAYYLLVDADTLLTNGKYYCPIYKHMFAHGFAPHNPNEMCGVGFENIDEFNIGFMQNGKSFTLINSENERIQLEVLNLTGQMILSHNVNSERYDYQNDNLPNGVYLVTVRTKDASKTFKWCKAR